MEEHDLFDRNRNFTNTTVVRGNIVPDGCFRQVVHVVIFNNKKEMLIQQRQPWRTHSNMWDITCGGSVIKGEESWQGAERELFEELGIKCDFSQEFPSLTVMFYEERDRGFDDFYILTKDVLLSELVLQDSEVKNAKWATKNEILDMIDNQQFIKYKKSLIEYLFESQDKKFGTLYKN